ncbi:hypothetical protein CASFOL_016130 [Castilleja foliolosa]|uniref:Uncharacterized protein n=1 Tax=Castilleja foliolosa TaxID=1961234 RepID=A0ABD3DJF0_9LAMI
MSDRVMVHSPSIKLLTNPNQIDSNRNPNSDESIFDSLRLGLAVVVDWDIVASLGSGLVGLVLGQKIEQYKNILATVLSSNDVVQAKQFIDHMLLDDVPLVVSRQLLQTFAQELGRLELEFQKEIAHYTLNQIQPRVVSFEEQVKAHRINVFY